MGQDLGQGGASQRHARAPQPSVCCWRRPVVVTLPIEDEVAPRHAAPCPGPGPPHRAYPLPCDPARPAAASLGLEPAVRSGPGLLSVLGDRADAGGCRAGPESAAALAAARCQRPPVADSRRQGPWLGWEAVSGARPGRGAERSDAKGTGRAQRPSLPKARRRSRVAVAAGREAPWSYATRLRRCGRVA